MYLVAFCGKFCQLFCIIIIIIIIIVIVRLLFLFLISTFFALIHVQIIWFDIKYHHSDRLTINDHGKNRTMTWMVCRATGKLSARFTRLICAQQICTCSDAHTRATTIRQTDKMEAKNRHKMRVKQNDKNSKNSRIKRVYINCDGILLFPLSSFRLINQFWLLLKINLNGIFSNVAGMFVAAMRILVGFERALQSSWYAISRACIIGPKHNLMYNTREGFFEPNRIA